MSDNAEQGQQVFQPIASQVPSTSATEGQVESRTQDERSVDEIDSLCLHCHQQGVTRMLLTIIPYFREVVLMSFKCEHCGNSNNEIQSAREIRARGSKYTVQIETVEDLNRQLVRSNTASISLKEFEMELPPGKGNLSTIEGLLRDIVADLSLDQPLRKAMQEPEYEKIDELITKLRAYVPDEDDEAAEDAERKFPSLTLIVRDPAGNSFVEFLGDNMSADPRWTFSDFARTRAENELLGLVASQGEVEAATEEEALPALAPAKPDLPRTRLDDEDVPEEIFSFPGDCSSCGHPANTNMKKVDIPYFKEIMLMSTHCDHCGYKDNEIKSGGAIPSQGCRITLKVEDASDLSRDVLKSETCGLSVPDIGLTLQPGTLGGRFTTLEGLLRQVHSELGMKIFADAGGDSTRTEEGKKTGDVWRTFLASLDECANGSRPFTITLDDPLAGSHVQNLYAPDPDPNMNVEWYDRTFEQNDELGLNDMVLENYEPSAEHEVEATEKKAEEEVDATEKKTEQEEERS